MITICLEVQVVDPPVTVGRLGRVRSSRTVAELPATVQPDPLPALSTPRNCTLVVPSAEMTTELPFCGADQAPLLNEVSYR